MIFFSNNFVGLIFTKLRKKKPKKSPFLGYSEKPSILTLFYPFFGRLEGAITRDEVYIYSVRFIFKFHFLIAHFYYAF